MTDWFRQLHQHRYFLLFILLFGYVQSVYMRVSEQQELNIYIFTPESVIFTLIKSGILFGIMIFFIRKWLKSTVFSFFEVILVFGTSLLTFLIGMKGVGLLVAIAFDTVEANFNQKTFLFTLFSDFLDGIIYGSFFLAYYYYQKNKVYQQQLTTYNQALADSRIHQLKTQLNPHFLFNNLNVLDQLIEEDKQKASDFLNEFANIYRYVLQASDKKLISLGEELIFIEQYIGLIRQKYGLAYQIRIVGDRRTGYLVPLTLQLLVENAVQHNLGTEDRPIIVSITITDSILVSNNLNLKKTVRTTSGRALNNLKEQYDLLTNKPVTIQTSETSFSITIPLINTATI